MADEHPGECKAFKAELLKQVREVGKSLFEHPERYVPTVPYLSEFHIDIRFGMNSDPLPEIHTDYSHIPADFIARYETEVPHYGK